MVLKILSDGVCSSSNFVNVMSTLIVGIDMIHDVGCPELEHILVSVNSSCLMRHVLN